MEVGNIIKGHINEILGLNKDISKERLKICKECPLFLDQFGGICNPKLYMNPKTQDISLEPKDGYNNGCGCRLLAKTTIPDAKCPNDKW